MAKKPTRSEPAYRDVKVTTPDGVTTYRYEEPEPGVYRLVEVIHESWTQGQHPPPVYLPDGRMIGAPPPDFSSLPVGAPAPKSLSEEELERRIKEKEANAKGGK